MKNKRNAADHPAALLGGTDITVEDVLASEVLAWPVQRLDVSPISDGAVALVMASEEVARHDHRPPRLDPRGGMEPRHHVLDEPRPRLPRVRRARRADGVRHGRRHRAAPRRSTSRSRTTRSTTRSCTTSKGCCCSTRGRAPEAVRDGVTARDGDLPCTPQRRAARGREPDRRRGADEGRRELFWQLRGEAGGRQVPGTPERGVAQAWGDLMQVGHRRRAGDRRRSAGHRRRRRAQPHGPARDADGRRGVPRRRPAPSRPASTARYRWDPGEAMGRFLDGLAEGTVLATVCASCARTLVPPRAFCERCFRPIDGWAEVPDVGVVETYSRCHVAWDMQRARRARATPP